MTRAHYEAETFIENRLDAPLKAIVGTNHGRKWPRFKTNDIKGLLERGTIADLEKLIANPGRKYREQYAHTYAINALKTVADSELLPDDVRALVQYVLELREKASDPFLGMDLSDRKQEQQGKSRVDIEAEDAEAQAHQDWSNDE